MCCNACVDGRLRCDGEASGGWMPSRAVRDLGVKVGKREVVWSVDWGIEMVRCQ